MDYYGYDYVTTGMDDASVAGLAGLGIGTLVIGLLVAVIAIVAMWKIYTKAGKPGWASIVPLYNLYVLFEVAGYNGWMFLLMCIPFVNFIMMILLFVKLAKAFGKSGGFAVGLIFLPFIFLLILAFGSAQYVGTEQTA